MLARRDKPLPTRDLTAEAFLGAYEGVEGRRKLAVYQGLVSLRSIVLIDAARRTIDVQERDAGDEWRSHPIPEGAPLILADPSLRVEAADLFSLA